MMETIDLQDQVRDHIKSHDLFNWHEALTENEMTLLENLLLTFAPKFYRGSVGFKETVEPYLEEKDRRIKELEEGLERFLHKSSGYRNFLKDKYLQRFQEEFDKAKQLLNL